MGNARYIGRVGGLAVALGIGVAICGSAGAAWAEEGASESSGSSATATSDTTSESVADEGAPHSAGEGTAEREAPTEADEDEPSRRGTSKRSVTDPGERQSRKTERVTVTDAEGPTEPDEKPDDSPAPAAALTMTTAAGAGRREDNTAAAAPTYAPSSVTVGQGPAGVALGNGGTRAYVANSTGRSVSVVDTTTGAVVKTIPVSGTASAVAVHGTRAYVTLRSTGRVAVIDTSTSKVVSLVSVGWSPTAIALSSNGDRAYVSNTGSGTMSVIDTATNKKLAVVGVGWSPAGVAVSPDNARVYVAAKGSDRITVVSAASNRVIANVAVGDSPRDVAVALGGRLYVAYGTGNVAVIDTASNSVVVPSISVGPTPTALAIARDVPRVFVANSNDTVTEIDTVTNTVIQNIVAAPTTNTGEHDIAVSADGKRIYVSDFRDGALRVISRVNAAPMLVEGPFTRKPDVITGVVYGSVRVLDADGDALRHSVSRHPAFGDVVITPSTGPLYTSFGFTYTPTEDGRLQADDPGGIATDNFTLEVSDPSGAAISVSFTVEIEPIHVTTNVTPIPVGDAPVGSVVSGNELYVVNGGAGTISVVDRSSNRVTHTLPMAGSSLVASPDGKYVYFSHGRTDGLSNTVTVIDTASKTLTNLAEIPRGDDGYNSGAALALSPDGKRLYVANRSDSLVSVVDTSSGQIVSTTDLGYWDGELAVTPDGTRLYRTMYFGDVQVIDVTGTPKVTAAVDVMPDSTSFVAQTLVINPEGTRAYVLTGETLLGANGSISVIDIDPDSPTYNLEVDFGYVEWQDRMAIDFANGKVYLSNYYSATGRILDLKSLALIGEFVPGGYLTADSGTVYVSDPYTDTVYAIDVAEPDTTSTRS